MRSAALQVIYHGLPGVIFQYSFRAKGNGCTLYYRLSLSQGLSFLTSGKANRKIQTDSAILHMISRSNTRKQNCEWCKTGDSALQEAATSPRSLTRKENILSTEHSVQI